MACSCSAPVAAGPRSSRSRTGVPATATHYDVLGVSPDASHDEVKRAYTRQAFTWHPDRRGDLDDAGRARADFRMGECNAAWAVLRSPASRAAYDDELRRDGLLPARSGAGADGPTARPTGGADCNQHRFD